ncbi:MAG: helix-turn-helix domain-containing protein, partial [Candidatus Pacearchaeota archaeon]
ALLGKGIASAGEVAVISRVPRSRTYDVLESLEKKGFAIVKLGKPVKYIGVKPKLILEKLKNNVRSDADERIVTLSNVMSTNEYEQLEQLYKGGVEPIKREDLSLALNGKGHITNHLREILENAEKEVIVCLNAEEMRSKMKLFSDTFGRLKKAGIKIKVALSGDEILIKKISEVLNIKVNKIDIDAKFFIVDRKEILFYLLKENKEKNDEDMAIWLNSEFFASAFTSLFDKAMKGGSE